MSTCQADLSAANGFGTSPGWTQRGGRESQGGGLSNCVARWLPAVLLPLAVCMVQLESGTIGSAAGLRLIFLALALGVVISAAVPHARLAALATVVVTVLLIAFGYVEELQAAELSRATMAASGAEGAPRLPPSFWVPGATFGAVRKAGENVAQAAVKEVTLETISVVLPCAFEGGFAGQTVDAIWKHTAHSRLKEIIVVDDGSRPPLKDQFPSRLLRGSNDHPPVRIIRNEQTIGLIGAKKIGGDAAHGDVIVFFDCHVSPRDGWEEAFLKQMTRKSDHRTVVVPTITALDPDTWSEIPNFPQAKACFLMLSGDFTWLGHPGRDVPLMSGGLLGISRRWWKETGGLDEHMVAWGGENIDQSLRTWLCGGRIEIAEGAYVAHMWRDPQNPKTALKYPIPTKDVMRNKARAVSAWYGDLKNKTFLFPEYAQFASGESHIGDMGNFDRIKSDLKCARFPAYIERFSYIYLDAGLIPPEVFQLREDHTGFCLERSPQQKPPHSMVLAPCSGDGVHGGPTSELQLFHVANRDRSQQGSPCCSGINNWNFLQCLDGSGVGSPLRTFECAIAGTNRNQYFHLADDLPHLGQLVWRNGEACVSPEEPKVADATRSAIDTCLTRVEAVGVDNLGPLGNASPTKFRLRHVHKSSGDAACAVAAGDRLAFEKCAEGGAQQMFHATALLGGLQVRVGDGNRCLDAGGGNQLLVYPCYDASAKNPNQIWHIRGGQLAWQAAHNAQGYCVDIAYLQGQLPPVVPTVGTGEASWRTCAPTPGQRLDRHDAHSGTFLLRNPDSLQCLRSEVPGAPLQMGPCDEHQRWRALEDRKQVLHVHSEQCIAARTQAKPSLTRCTSAPTDHRAGRYEHVLIVDDPGWIQMQGGWADNGRVRWFEKCIDFQPQSDIQVSLQQCDKTKARNVRWTRIGVRTPPETEIWRNAEKPPPGTPVLGGDAQPP